MLEDVKRERGDVLPVRAAIALAVPALGVTAHGSAGGGSASASDRVLLSGVGAVAATAAAPSHRNAADAVRRPLSAMLRLAVVLSTAQVAAHLLLAAGTHPMPAHASGLSWSMLAAHAAATGLTAVAIAVAAQLAQVVGAVLVAVRRLVAGQSTPQRVARVATGTARRLSSAVLSGAGGVRGPPGMVAAPSL